MPQREPDGFDYRLRRRLGWLQCLTLSIGLDAEPHFHELEPAGRMAETD